MRIFKLKYLFILIFSVLLIQSGDAEGNVDTGIRNYLYYSNGNLYQFPNYVAPMPPMQAMSNWKSTFNQDFQRKLNDSMNSLLMGIYYNLQARPSLQQLKNFSAELQNPQSNLKLDPLKLAQINSLIQQFEYDERVLSIPFLDSSALKSLEAPTIEASKRTEHYKKLSEKYGNIPESKFDFQTPFSSPLGVKIHTLQEDILSSLSQNNKTADVIELKKSLSRQLWLADHYSRRQDFVKAQFIANEVSQEQFSDDETAQNSSYLGSSFADYTRNHLLYTSDFKNFAVGLLTSHASQIALNDFSFIDSLNDKDFQDILNKYFPKPLPPEIISNFKESFKENLSDLALQSQLSIAANKLGYLGVEESTLIYLAKTRSFVGASSDIHLSYLVSKLRSAQNVLNKKLSNANLPQNLKDTADNTLTISSELVAKAEQSLAESNLVTASIYLEASRKMALNGVLQATNEATIVPFGTLGNRADPSIAKGLTELSQLMLSGGSGAGSIAAAVNQLEPSDFTRFTQGIFFTPDNTKDGRLLREGISSLAKSIHQLKSYASYFPDDYEKADYIRKLEDLDLTLGLGYLLADHMNASDAFAAHALLKQLSPITNLLANLSQGVIETAVTSLVQAKELAFAISDAVNNAINSDPMETLNNVKDGIAKLLSTPYGPLFCDAIDKLASETHQTLLYGTTAEKQKLLGRATFEVLTFLPILKSIKGAAFANGAMSAHAILESSAARTLQHLSVNYELAKLSASAVITDTLKAGYASFTAQTPELAAAFLSQKAPLSTLEKVVALGATEISNLKTLEALDSTLGASVITELSKTTQTTSIANQAVDIVGASLKVSEADRATFAQKLAQLSPATVEATELKEVTVYRAVRKESLVKNEYNPWSIGPQNIASDHRYSKEGIGGLYVSTKEKTALAEASFYETLVKDERRNFVEYDTVSKSINIHGLLDLSDSVKVKNVLGIDASVLKARWKTKADYEFTQAIGERARAAGFKGVIFKSAHTEEGANIVIFADELNKEVIK